MLPTARERPGQSGKNSEPGQSVRRPHVRRLLGQCFRISRYLDGTIDTVVTSLDEITKHRPAVGAESEQNCTRIGRCRTISSDDDRRPCCARNRYLRGLFVAGALAVIRYAKIHGTKHRPWLAALLARRPTKVAAIALQSDLPPTVQSQDLEQAACVRRPFGGTVTRVSRVTIAQSHERSRGLRTLWVNRGTR